MTNNTPDKENPVYVAICEADLAKSPKEFYKSIRDVTKFVNSPEGKSLNARFKKFKTPGDAADFLDNSFCSPSIKCEDKEKRSKIASEPKSPYSTVSRIQMNEFKRYVEKGDIDGFKRLVEQNPTFLINTGGDIAAIVMEGFRYNALHIASKNGQAKMIENLLKYVNDTDFLLNLYQTNLEDVETRKTNILKSYLNTPDKGKCDTPLHFATRHGRLDAVKVLVGQPLLDRHVKNKDGLTAFDVVCERYHEGDRESVEKAIKLLLRGHYVVLARDLNYSYKLRVTEDLLNENFDELKICAVAGPFESEIIAQEFQDNWKYQKSMRSECSSKQENALDSPKDLLRTHRESLKKLKCSDAEKGYEKAGRYLCKMYKNIEFKESWRFLDDNILIDVKREEGLEVVNSYLEKRMGNSELEHNDKCDDEDHKISARTLDFSLLDDRNDSDDEEYFDASELDIELNESLGWFAEKFAELSIKSPKREEAGDFNDDDDEELFVTPPSSPTFTHTFILDDFPCKTDNDLFEVLQEVPESVLSKYAYIKKYMDNLRRHDKSSRQNWPGVDSVRRLRSYKRL